MERVFKALEESGVMFTKGHDGFIKFFQVDCTPESLY